MTARTWEGDALPLPGGQVLLSRRAAAVTLATLEAYRRHATARDGGTGRLAADLAAVVDALHVAARSLPGAPMSDNGHADIPPAAPAPPWPTDEDELLPTKEAAKLLWISDRHVRRLADAGELGPVQRAGRSRLLHRTFVDAYAETRPTEEP